MSVIDIFDLIVTVFEVDADHVLCVSFLKLIILFLYILSAELIFHHS